jgi:hypothetical protein
VTRDRRERVVVSLGASENGNFGVEKSRQTPNDPRFRLSSLTEKDNVLARKYRVFDLRNNGVVETDDAPKIRFTSFDLGDKVLTKLGSNG